jgi:hypothetical protein
MMLVAIAGACSVASWGLAPKILANRRATEMSVMLAAQELERLKAFKYDGLTVTPVGTPNTFYYDKLGALLGSATGATYKVKSWVIPQDSNGDSVLNTADLRELTVEVWTPNESRRYERAVTLLTKDGI